MDTPSATADARVVSPAREPNIATGVAVFTLLMVLWVAGRELWLLRPHRLGASMGPVCARPVEVHAGEDTDLSCGDEPGLSACGAIEAGDAVTLGEGEGEGEGALRVRGSCFRVASGMSAPMRLLVGLPLDVNRVSANELELLEELGPVAARAIVAHRDHCGPYRDVTALARVRGLGRKRAELLAARLYFGDGAPARPSGSAPPVNPSVNLGECAERE